MGVKQGRKGLGDIVMYGYVPPRGKGSLYENSVKLKEKGYRRNTFVAFKL